MELNYKYIDRKSDTCLVFVNGLFASLESWDPVLAASDIKESVLTYDCRGQGESPDDGKYSLEESVIDLKNLLDSLTIDNILLVGISNGARIALKFSEYWPMRVKAVAAFDTYDKVTPLLKLKIESWLSAHKLGGGEHRFDIATPWIWSEKTLVEADLVNKYRSLAAKRKSADKLIEGALSGDVNLFIIKTPILLGVGSEDILTPVSSHKSMREKLSKCELIEVEGAHASLLEYPDHFNNYVYPFLRKFL